MTLPDVWRALHERDAEALEAAIAASGTEVRDRGGGTPLMEAVTRGEAAFVEMLLGRGADPNAQSREGVTALHLACIHHRVEIARTLLRAGARHDLPDCGGNAPLARAVFESRGRGEMIRLLLDAGADPDAANARGVTARMLAARIANYDLARFLE